MSISLARIVEDDPSLRFTRNPETSESLLTGLGEVQIEVALGPNQAQVRGQPERAAAVVPYRETITRITNSEYRHKKTNRRSGQYGHVLLRLEAAGCATKGLSSATRWSAGRVPRELIPAVEKGVVNMLKEACWPASRWWT